MHPFVASIRQVRSGSRVLAFVRALTLPFHAIALLWRQRQLWPLVIVPAAINVALFIGGAALVLAYADSAAQLLWVRPEIAGLVSAALAVIWYLMYAALLVLGLVTAYIATLLIGGIVASPFNDVLGERVERIVMGTTGSGAERPLWKEALMSIRSSVVVVLLYALLMGPVLLLNVVPVVGSVTATVLGVAVGAFFLALEFADAVLARHGYALRERIRLLRRNWPLAGGFGLSTSMLLWIPFLNVLCIPIAVVGGTLLALALVEP